MTRQERLTGEGGGRGLVVLLVGCALLLFAGCATTRGGRSADLAVADAVMQAHSMLLAGLEAGSVTNVLEHMDASAELLLFHPFREDRFDGREEVRRGLARMFARLGDLTWTEAHASVAVEGHVAWITSHFVLEAAAKGLLVDGRSTEIWRRRGTQWYLVHGHWSRNPETAPAVARAGF